VVCYFAQTRDWTQNQKQLDGNNHELGDRCRGGFTVGIFAVGGQSSVGLFGVSPGGPVASLPP
jgi:hypothetical protein